MRTPEEKQFVHESVRALIQQNPRSACTGDTLLHLCVSKLNTIKSSYFADDNQVIYVISALLHFNFTEC